MHIIVAGSRTFDDYPLLKNTLDRFIKQHSPNFPGGITIISGTANGADKLGERYAREHNYEIICMPAKWEHGKAAGPIRNREMAEAADACVVFWVQEHDRCR